MTLFNELTLPCGQTLKNRFVKAAMEENLAEADQSPGNALKKLYAKWAQGGAGLIITGNVMVDRFAMTGPGGVALEHSTPLDEFERWAKVSKQNNTKVIMQINHPGRQVFKKMGGKVLSPSNVALNMGKHSGLFVQPKAMTEDEIFDVIGRFVTTASRAKDAGFDGVEIHAAHGYLISQFLSPLTNRRDDKWGGDLDYRTRILFDVVKKVREACGQAFIVAVKLNSADFQRGGFDTGDAIYVVKKLSAMNVDLIELSGGSYEAPAMQGKSGDERTLSREAYFLEFAKRIAEHATVPVMVTGGIKRYSVAQDVIDSGIELIGMASALAYEPDLINKWQTDKSRLGTIPNITWKDKTLSGLANMALVKRQLRRIGSGKTTKFDASGLFTLIMGQIRQSILTKRYRRNVIDKGEHKVVTDL